VVKRHGPGSVALASTRSVSPAKFGRPAHNPSRSPLEEPMKPWFGYHIPSFTFRDIPPEKTFDRVVELAQAAEKAGFVREGVARNACCVNGGRMDMVLFSLVPDDLLTSGDSGAVIEGQEQVDRSLG